MPALFPVNKLFTTLNVIEVESVLKLNGGFNTCKTEILPILLIKILSLISILSLFHPKSKNIGNIKELRIINEGFEYSSDKTLQPF